MKNLRNKLSNLWTDEPAEEDTIQLSRKTMISLRLGTFIVCLLVIAITYLIFNVQTAMQSRQTEQSLYQLLDTVAVYMASATDDEYAEITQQLRDDLVLSKYSQNIEKYVHYIPNTAEECCAEQETYAAQVYLVCANTGKIYPLDLYETGKISESREYVDTIMQFVYDEISQTNAHIMRLPAENKTAVTFSQGRSVVSVHRLKGLFCDSCINKILAAAEGSIMPEYLLFDPENMVYYPITEGTQTIGSYLLNTGLAGNGYEIEVEYK